MRGYLRGDLHRKTGGRDERPGRLGYAEKHRKWTEELLVDATTTRGTYKERFRQNWLNLGFHDISHHSSLMLDCTGESDGALPSPLLLLFLNTTLLFFKRRGTRRLHTGDDIRNRNRRQYKMSPLQRFLHCIRSNRRSRTQPAIEKSGIVHLSLIFEDALYGYWEQNRAGGWRT